MIGVKDSFTRMKQAQEEKRQGRWAEHPPSNEPCAVTETSRMIGRSPLRGDSPNLIEQRLRGNRASEELFQQHGRFEFFTKAE